MQNESIKTNSKVKEVLAYKTSRDETLNANSKNISLIKQSPCLEAKINIFEKKPPKITRNSKFRYSNYMSESSSNSSVFKPLSPLSAMQDNHHYSSSSTNLNFGSNLSKSIVSNCIMKFEKQQLQQNQSNSSSGLSTSPTSMSINTSENFDTKEFKAEMGFKNTSSISIKKVR